MYDGLLLDHDGVIVTLGETSALRDAASAAFRNAGIPDPQPDDIEALSIKVDAAEPRTVSQRYDVDADRLWRTVTTLSRKRSVPKPRLDEKHLTTISQSSTNSASRQVSSVTTRHAS